MKQYLLSVIYRNKLLCFVFFVFRDLINQYPTKKYENIIKNYKTHSRELFIDCGANVGDSMKAALKLGFKEVVAFEPNDYCYNILRYRFLGQSNITVINSPVWDREEVVKLYFPKLVSVNPAKHSSSTTINTDHSNSDKGSYHQLESIRLSSYIFSLSKKVSFLKIDVEGVENDILNDLIESNAYDDIEFIAVETHETLIKNESYIKELDSIKNRVKDLGLSKKIKFDWI